MFNLQELIKYTGAKVLKNDLNDKTSFIISTDTRSISINDIYLPLKGASFNGEDFIDKAIEASCFAYFTTKDYVAKDAKLVLKIEDSLKAYLNLANYYSKRINPITICITGSSGKTTTKELIYSVLSQKYNAVKTFLNHNNEIGFCQTVLSCNKDTEVLIIEAGMRGLGEIELISKHARPDYAIITNSGSAHVGRLGSLDNIAKAKCEIASGLDINGVFIAKNQDIIKKYLNFNGEKIYYSIEDVKINDMKQGYSKFLYKNEEYELNVDGEYNIENSLSAIELGFKMGLSIDQIRQGLLSYQPIEKRWEVTNIDNYHIINDSYNANPESMVASVKTFIQLYKNPILVLGDMGELGDESPKYHVKVANNLKDEIIKNNVRVLTVGKLAKNIYFELKSQNINVSHFYSNEEVSEYILDNFNDSNTIFLKASRSMQFEQIIEILKRGMCKL